MKSHRMNEAVGNLRPLTNLSCSIARLRSLHDGDRAFSEVVRFSVNHGRMRPWINHYEDVVGSNFRFANDVIAARHGGDE